MINYVQICSMVDPCVLTSPAFRFHKFEDFIKVSFRKVLIAFVIFVGSSNC